jgi:hypothetical protein
MGLSGIPSAQIPYPMKSATYRCFALAASMLLAGTSFAADVVLGKASENKIHAQALVNRQTAKPENKDLSILGLHAIVPGAAVQTMIACNLDRIGKADSEDDIIVTKEHKTMVFPKLSKPGIFEVMTPLKDSSGNVIGMLVFVFDGYKAGADETPYYLRAMKMREEMARETPSYVALFKRI